MIEQNWKVQIYFLVVLSPIKNSKNRLLITRNYISVNKLNFLRILSNVVIRLSALSLLWVPLLNELYDENFIFVWKTEFLSYFNFMQRFEAAFSTCKFLFVLIVVLSAGFSKQRGRNLQKLSICELFLKTIYRRFLTHGFPFVILLRLIPMSDSLCVTSFILFVFSFFQSLLHIFSWVFTTKIKELLTLLA